LLSVALFTGCRAEVIGEVDDPAQVKAVAIDYYQAFDSYDLSRIE